MYNMGVSVLYATVGISSNNPEFVDFNELWHHNITNFYKIEKVQFNEHMDGYIVIFDNRQVPPYIEFINGSVIAVGDFSRLNREVKDRFYTFFGNQGIFLRQVIYLLESQHNIHSLHACGVYDPESNDLFIIYGPSGCGKSCVMLRAIEKGLKLFSADILHFKVKDDDVIFFKGPMKQGVRVGTLKHHFYSMLDKLEVKLPDVPDEWSEKIRLHLEKFETKEKELRNPNIVIVSPWMSGESNKTWIKEEKDNREIIKSLFLNCTEKIGQTFLLYESIPVQSFDNQIIAEKRLKDIKKLVKSGLIKRYYRIVASPDNDLREIFEDKS